MSIMIYIEDEDGNIFRTFNNKEVANEFLALRPDCKINKIEEQKEIDFVAFTKLHGEPPF